MKYKIIIYLMLLFNLSYAQQKWSLKQCIDTALTNNLNIQQTINAVKTNEISLKQSKANLYPSLNANAGKSFSSNKYANTFSDNSYSLNSSVNLFNGFQNNNTIKQSKIELDASNYDLESIKNDIKLNIVDAYLQVLYANELVKNAINQVDGTYSQLDNIKQFVLVGKKSESDLLELESQLASDKLSKVNAEGQLKSTKLKLQQLINIPLSQGFNIDYPDLIEPNDGDNGSIDNIYNEALSVQPIIKSNELKTQSAMYGIKIAKGAVLPKLAMNGSLSNEPTFTKMLSLSLSIPIYNNSQVKYNIQKQNINLTNSILNEQIGKNNLRKNVEQAYIDAENAKAKYLSVKEQVNATSASNQNSKMKYENGMISTSDLLIEKNKYTNAQSNLIQAKYELIFCLKILDYYRGKNLNF